MNKTYTHQFIIPKKTFTQDEINGFSNEQKADLYLVPVPNKVSKLCKLKQSFSFNKLTMRAICSYPTLLEISIPELNITFDLVALNHAGMYSTYTFDKPIYLFQDIIISFYTADGIRTYQNNLNDIAMSIEFQLVKE